MNNGIVLDDLVVKEFEARPGCVFVGTLRHEIANIEYPFIISLYYKPHIIDGVAWFNIKYDEYKQSVNLETEEYVDINPYSCGGKSNMLKMFAITEIKKYFKTHKGLETNILYDLKPNRPAKKSPNPFQPLADAIMNPSSYGLTPMLDPSLNAKKYLVNRDDTKAFFIIDTDNEPVYEGYWYEQGVDTVIIYKVHSKDLVILCDPKYKYSFISSVFEGVAFKKDPSDFSSFIPIRKGMVEKDTALKIYENIEKYISVDKVEE